MKPIPIALLLAATAPIALAAQEAPAPDPADTLRAVEMTAVAQHAHAPDYDVTDPVIEAHYPPALKAAGVGGRVMVRMVVDAHGRAVAPRVAETSGHGELDAAALRVAEALRYTPARRLGTPHPVWANFPVLFRPGRDWVEGATADQVRAWADSAGAVALSRVDRAPSVIGTIGWARAEQEAYPPALRDAGARGTAVVWFVVGTRGTPESIRLARSAGNPELDRGALQAVEKMRFSPALRAGEPVAAWMAHDFPFEPRARAASRLLPNGGYHATSVEEMPQLANRERVARLIAEAYPPALRAQGVAGEATVRMLIDPRGVPGRVEVVESTNAEFGAAAVRVAEQMRFRPARTEGKPVEVEVMLPLYFKAPAPAGAALAP
ncbi:MAG TPA: energy transducer TonB [Longimicrobium sp.]|nr:energy transducer TonB [Longimicrobium sp.]